MLKHAEPRFFIRPLSGSLEETHIFLDGKATYNAGLLRAHGFRCHLQASMQWGVPANAGEPL